MGDNRDESRDGRYFGTRPVTELLGRATGVLWSWHPEWLRGPRLKRFARRFMTVVPAGTPAAWLIGFLRAGALATIAGPADGCAAS